MKKYIENLFSTRGTGARGVGFRGVLLLLAVACALATPRVVHAATYQNMGSDRILLMNNDSRNWALGGIASGQGYWDTNTTVGTTYWTHVPNNDNRAVLNLSLLHGYEHILHAPDGTPLWHLVDCRAGNVNISTIKSRIILPWSGKNAQISKAPSASWMDGTTKITTQDNTAGACIIMRDNYKSAVYSPYYGEGIGTIYFDTVNSFPTTVETIQIQIATNLTEEAILYNESNPDDSVAFEDVHKTVEFDKWDHYYDWQAIPVTYLDIKNKSASLPITTDSTNLVLNVTDAGTNHFFRVRTQLNYYGPIRFRIKKITDTVAEQGSDAKNLVLIDNILVSYPPMTIRFHRQGHPYDETLRGSSVLGCIGDFDKPFLTYADKTVNAGINYSWVTNFQGTNIQITVNNIKFNYRWRYLDQKVNPWRTVNMTTNKYAAATVPSASISYSWKPGQTTAIVAEQFTNLYTTAGIPLSDGVGDVEYFFSANVNAPYYNPRDYIHDIGIFGNMDAMSSTSWKEQPGAITNRMEVAEDFKTPAMGRDYFTRIREGVSDYKWVALCTTVTTNGHDSVSEECRMELVGDHTWRYHYYVPTNMVGETFSFHFKGEQIYTNAWVSGYLSATNTWYCDLAELPYIPYTSAAGLGYHNDISCKLDPAATHLMIEFNDELLSFSISHASYQNFNAWTDATMGYVGHTNWNGEGAIGVSDAKKKYTLKMSEDDGWENSSFDSEYWYEEFNTKDNTTYPFNVIFDEHATPNGWTAGHGQFIRSQRGQDEGVALQLEGRGQGWIGMDNFSSEMMPKGIDEVTFKCRLAQEPRFDDFAWYMDGISYTNYAFAARIAMGVEAGGTTYNPPDVSPGTPSVSLVGYYRPAVGCYEFRITRSGQYQLCAAIYKWTQGPLGMQSMMLCSNAVSITEDVQYALPGNLQPKITKFGNYLVGKDKAAGSASCACFSIRKVGGQVELRGYLSKTWGGIFISNDTLEQLVSCTDSSSPLTKGTFGVGSTECNARFYAPSKHVLESTGIYNKTPTYMTGTRDDWAYYSNRWKWDSAKIDTSEANFHAVVPTNQTIKLEFKAPNDRDGWKPSGYEAIVDTYSTNKVYRFTPQVSPSYQVRLRTGGNTYDEVRTDLVVDEIRVRAWQANDYPDLWYDNGKGFNWVYTQGVVEPYGGAIALRLQPSRGVPEKAMSLRSPFLGNGISMFSFDYANADANAELLLQVCTNNMYSVGSVSEALTTYPSGNDNWTTVTNWSFSKMTSTERDRGTLMHYMSFRAPIMGLVRLVVPTNVLEKCIADEGKATRNVNYGQVTITGAYCYDEPALDMRSWYAWNFHTAGWNTSDKRFAYLFDSPDGLSGSLNFSALDGDNAGVDAAGIGLSDRDNIAAYQGNNSFVQCPPMTNGIGSVSFRARTFMTNETTIAAGQGSWVTLYGSFEPDDDQVVSPESWKFIDDFYITNTTYQTFQWKTTDDSSQYHAIRLEVAGSRHGRYPSSAGEWEKPRKTPLQRVLIDEISVGEPIQPRIVFRNVRPFRSGVVDIPPCVVSNVTDLSEQPLFGESWGLQCTIEPQQMGDELDQDSIKVYAAFKRGIAPWGYVNWSNEVDKVVLDRIGDTLTFRSTWIHPESIVSPVDTPTSTYPDNVWQYYIWCEFKDKAGNQHRHALDAVDWTVPSWYFGIKDLNEQFRSQGFSGYTILDTISPKRAWINEVNICDNALFDNSDSQNQFIEIAVPRGADLTAWSLNVIGTGLNRGVIATYGFHDATIVPNPKVGKLFGIDWTNDYTVVALRSPEAKRAGRLANSDGAWNMLDSSTCNNLQLESRSSSFYYYESYGIELVRPSGVIEHQVVVQGTNTYAGTLWEEFGSGTNLLAKVAAMDGPQSQWIYAGEDGDSHTLGVFKSHGEDSGCWTNLLVSSPAELNKFEDGTRQLIDEGWFLQPLGDNVWIYANVYSDNIHQTIGSKTNATEVFIIPKGTSTNIVYNADKWWALGKVTTNGVVVAEADGRADRADNHRWVLNLPNVTDTLKVDAWGKAGSDVAGMGLPESDPYFPAVMKWLASKDDSKGLFPVRYSPFSGEPESGKEFLGIKDMYWLDIDPTVEGLVSGENAWVFRAGIGGTGLGSDAIQPVYFTDYDRVYTNSRVTVTMMISNTVTKAARAPDHLLGLEPGSSSIDYDLGSPAWTSVTFKVVGALQRTGDEWTELRKTYYPLRWFVFTPGSFDENFTATIDLWEPHSDNSPGMFYGWGDFPEADIWYKWRLDGDPAWYDTAEPLKAKSTYSE